MSEESARPQDVGRSHARRRRDPGSPVERVLLERYRAAMRDELGELLDELRPAPTQTALDGTTRRVKPALGDRIKGWDLAIKLGRELTASSGLDLGDPGSPAPASSGSRSSGTAPRLSARERRALGGT